MGPHCGVQILLHRLVLRALLIDFEDYDDEDRGTSSGPDSEHAGRLEVMTDITVDDSNLSSSSANTLASSDDRARIIQQSADRSAKSDWRRLAVVVDRCFFVVFAVILIATCLAFAGYL